jgi:hypothetical protein
MLRDRGMGYIRRCGETLDAAGRTGERCEHQQENERDCELGAARHQQRQ